MLMGGWGGAKNSNVQSLIGTVFALISSRTALTWHTGMMTAFDTKCNYSEYFRIFIMIYD